jgi:hypothetical protein
MSNPGSQYRKFRVGGVARQRSRHGAILVSVRTAGRRYCGRALYFVAPTRFCIVGQGHPNAPIEGFTTIRQETVYTFEDGNIG